MKGYYGLLPGVPQLYATTVEGIGAGNTYNPIRPAAGEIWILHSLIFTHDDVAARTLAFNWIDQATNQNISLGVSTVAGVYRSLFVDSGFAGPITMNRDSYIRCHAVDLAAGKYIHPRALVYKIRGVGVWNNA